MTKKQKLIRNLLILILLFFWVNAHIGASFTPLGAHRRSERSANYGPSMVVKTQKVKGGMLLLCKYDRWFSLNTVNKGPLWLWYAGNQVHGQENDIKEQIKVSYGNEVTDHNVEYWQFYGIVNNPAIKSVRLEIKVTGEPKIFEQKELYDNMFLFVWDEDVKNFETMKIMGLDKDSKVVYEKALP
jgi:hypothetical protein